MGKEEEEKERERRERKKERKKRESGRKKRKQGAGLTDNFTPSVIESDVD